METFDENVPAQQAGEQWAVSSNELHTHVTPDASHVQVKNAQLQHNAFSTLRKQGFNVFPLKERDKIPAGSWKQFQSEAATLKQCEIWDKARHNVAIITGHVSGCFVLDIDGDEGRKTLDALLQKHGSLPITATAKTARGMHYYFRYPEDCIIRNLAGKTTGGEVIPNIDVRGDGGYVAAPPSIHPSGAIYTWVHAPDEVGIVDAPEWLLDMCIIKENDPPPITPILANSKSNERYFDKALQGELFELRTAQEGTRNHQLNKAAFSLGRLIEAGLSEQLVRKRLSEVAALIGLDAKETERTIDSGLSGGKEHPRTIGENDNADDFSIFDPDPSVLRQGRRTPPIFPLDALGSGWASWLRDAAEGAGAPVDYVVGPLLAVAAALIGNARSASAWQGWTEPTALWLANVGTPSSGKSPGADPILNVVRELEKDMTSGFDEKLREWETKKVAATAAREIWEDNVKKALKNHTEPPVMPPEAMEPDEIVRPRIIGNDTTPEALGLLLSHYLKGLLFHRDEIAGWIGGFDKYGSKGSDRPFWTEAYGGRPYTIDRIKHKKPIKIPYLLVSVMGGIQPDRLVDVLCGDDDGLTARFLWLWPEQISPRRPKRIARADVPLAALQRLSELSLDDAEGDGNLRPRIIMLEPDAQEIFQHWRETQHASDPNLTGLIGSSIGKAPGHVLRLSLVLEYLWWAMSPHTDEPKSIRKEALVTALMLMEEYFKPMAERVFGDAAVPEEDRLAATMARWIVKNKASIINLREVRREARLPGLKTPEKVKMAANALIDAGWLFPPAAAGEKGRPRGDYIINPKLWEALAKAS